MVLELLRCLEHVHPNNVLSHDVSSMSGFNISVLWDSLCKLLSGAVQGTLAW